MAGSDSGFEKQLLFLMHEGLQCFLIDFGERGTDRKNRMKREQDVLSRSVRDPRVEPFMFVHLEGNGEKNLTKHLLDYVPSLWTVGGEAKQLFNSIAWCRFLAPPVDTGLLTQLFPYHPNSGHLRTPVSK